MSKIGTFEDFAKFAKSNTRMSNSVVDSLGGGSMMMPFILEEREMNVTQMDVFSRLMYDRIIYFRGEVNSVSCDTTIAQILYLSSVDKSRDINLYINSPGGSIVDGLGLIDTMNFVSCDISTMCVGMAASMGAVLLSNGAKGKRFVLPHSRVMVHSAASYHSGHVEDLRIEMEQTERCQKDIYKILSENTGFTYDEINELCHRDNWFIGEEAVKELRIADRVLEKEE